MPNTNSKRGNLIRLKTLKEAFRKSCCDLNDATAEELPVGTILEATLGKSRIRGRVKSHASGYNRYYAGTLIVTNLTTGKERRVNPSSESENVTIISLP